MRPRFPAGVLVLVSLVGCAPGGTHDPGLDYVTAATADALRSVSVPPDLAARITRPVHLVADPPAQGATSMPWRLVSYDGTEVRIVFAAGDGDCVLPHGVQVLQTGAAVMLTVWSRTNVSRTSCPSLFVGGEGTVTLDALLGSRQLVHARLSRSWAQTAHALLR